MTQTQLLFLQAAKAALRGKRVDWPEMEQEQWQELFASFCLVSQDDLIRTGS